MRDAKCLIWIGISDCALWVIIYKVYYEKNRNVYVYLQYWQMNEFIARGDDECDEIAMWCDDDVFVFVVDDVVVIYEKW